MKRAVLAIAAAVTLALGLSSGAYAQKVDKKAAEANAAALARVPTLAAATKVSCTPTGALSHGSFNRTENNVKINFDAIEAACSEGLGYVFVADEKNGPVKAYDCISQNASRAGNPKALGCDMAENAHPEKGLKPLLVKAGNPCEPTGARAIGATPSGTVIYEVACASGLGTFLVSPGAGAPEKLMAQSCFSSNERMACTLTTPAQIEAAAKALTAKADAKCAYEKQRFVMTTGEGDVIEVACAGGTGMMVVSKGGEYVSTVPCARAMGYQGGCQLSDVKAAQTAEADTYTQAAKKAGFNCDVEKYGVFPAPGGGKEIVELACKNRPDGAVAIFSGDGKDEILNCARSQIEGYRCSYSKVEPAYTQINEQLTADGKGACKVNAVRPIGVNAKNAFLEVSCSDGDPGWVLSYPRGVAKPDTIMSCGNARASGVGACDLPTNKKAAG